MLRAINYINTNQPTPTFYAKYNNSATDFGIAPVGVPTTTGGITYAAGKTGALLGAVQGNGTTGKIEYSDNDKFSFPTDGVFTFSFWCKITNTDVVSSTAIFFLSKFTSPGNNMEWAFYYIPSAKNIALVLYKNTSVNDKVERGSIASPYIVNQWHHYCFVYKGAKTIEVWKDNVCIFDGAMIETGTYTAMTNGTAPMRLFNFDGSTFTSGVLLDELKIWKGTALTAENVRHEFRQLNSKYSEQLVLRTTKNGTFTTSVTNSGSVLEYEEAGVIQKTNSFSNAFTGLGNTVQVRATGDWLGVTSFTCNSGGLIEFPQYLTNLTNLTNLTLFVNSIPTIPAEIGNLTKLVGFSIANNPLVSIPIELFNLVNLTVLDIVCTVNTISIMPSEIGNLVKLSNLNWVGTSISTIPTSIANLVKLTVLNCFQNQLTSIPIEVGTLPLLTNFRAYSNQITSVNINLFTNTKIAILQLNNNLLSQATLESCLDAIPLVIAPALRTIKLENNTGSAATAISRASLIANLNANYNYLITI
jgi:hypothetical protein